MCLILFAKNVHPEYGLIIAANRDEFYNRPTKEADFWAGEKHILAGKDLEAGGTWMGISKRGRLSMLTNYRDLKNIKSDAPSRGQLVADFLINEDSPENYLLNVAQKGQNYNGFNLIVGQPDNLHYYGNYQQGVHKIQNGVHGLSNALLNTPWPKVEIGKEKLAFAVNKSSIDTEELFDLLRDDIKAPLDQLPDTGIGLEKEKMLSPMFIKSENYGSRCSTIILIKTTGEVHFSERTYDPVNFSFSTKSYDFKI